MSTDLGTVTPPSVTEPDTGGYGVDPDRFRAALAHHAAGVVVVTVGEGPSGLTVGSFSSVSLRPPLVSFNVDNRSASCEPLRRAEWFGVNVLGAAQRELAARFAHRGADRFGPPTRWWPGPRGVPLLDGASVNLVCRRYRVIALGDHWLVVGAVTEVCGAGAGGAEPLLYHRGRYGRFRPAG